MQNQSAAQHYTSWTVIVNIISASNEPLISICKYNDQRVCMMLYRKFHAKSGPFLETKLNKVMFFCLFSMFLSVSTGGYGTELTAAEKKIVSSQVCLEIDRDGAVGPLVHYD